MYLSTILIGKSIDIIDKMKIKRTLCFQFIKLYLICNLNTGTFDKLIGYCCGYYDFYFLQFIKLLYFAFSIFSQREYRQARVTFYRALQGTAVVSFRTVR